jgi:hypothetical protein
MDLDLSNVVNISVSEAQTGLGEYNTSNIALFTHETPAGSFGSAGYAIYKSPTNVGIDFGTGSKTYKMALAIFSQQPNILANDGSLIIVLQENTTAPVTAVQHIDFSSVPTVGTYKLKYGALETAAIAFDDAAADVEDALQLLTGLGTVTVAGDTTAGFSVTFTGVTGPATLLVCTEDKLQDTDGVDVFLTIETTTPGVSATTAETLAESITRAVELVQFSGVMAAQILGESEMDAAAAVIQALNKIIFFVSRTVGDLEPGAMLDDLRTGSFTHSRGLYYGADNDDDALVFMAAYASKGMSVNFDGSKTTTTMHLKDLSGVDVDSSITQTILGKAQAAGVDVYPSLQGIAKVFCSGANHFFDQVYNLMWLVGALEIANFNYLAQSSTKIPQTEEGMSGLKGANRKVCEQAVANQYAAPGEWTNSTTFGKQEDFLGNIRQVGYYIYSSPISQQAPADREDRKAPLIQVALKEAGAVHSATILVNINA